MYEIDADVARRIDVILEADFLGRAQSLSPEEAQRRLEGSLRNRKQALEGKGGDPQLRMYWEQMGYRSVAYDAAGLTATLVRMYAGSEYELLQAHMHLMRSMITNDDEPNVGPLWTVMSDLVGRSGE